MNEPGEWFIARNKQKVGPFTWAQLVDQAGRGEIADGDMLLRQGQGKWVKAESLPGLFATPTSQVQETVSLVEPRPALSETVSHSDPMPSTIAAGSERTAGEALVALAGSIPGYEFLGVLGRGGMGVVYKARHLALDRVVAVKMIRGGDHAGAGHLERFRIEAQAVARLHHPNIVQIHEVGEHDGQPFFSLEFADGGTLSSRISGDPWSPLQAAELTEKLAQAMQHAHEHGIIHRDLKPGNVLFASDGTPKVSDFGLAKRLDIDQDLSQTGAVLGTPSYMAPEQAEGKSDLGPAADVYALGVILYELLTGRPPFKGATMLDTLEQVRSQEPVPPSRLAKVPVDLETICLKCLHKAPKQRYASAAELQDDLSRYLRGEPVRARPIGNLARAWRWCQRNKAVASLMALVVLALIAGTTVSTIFGVIANLNANALELNAIALKQKIDDEKKQRDIADGATIRANLAAADAKIKEKLADDKTLETQKALQEEQAATARANKEKIRGDTELERARANAFTTQMLRAGGLWEREPTLVRKLLDNQEICPPERRDLTWKLLDRLCRVEKSSGRLLTRMEVRLMATSSVGLVVTAHSDFAVSIYDKQRSINLFTRVDHAVRNLALTRDGKLLACAVSNNVELRSMPSLTVLATLSGHSAEVNCLAFSDDGKTLASGGNDRSVILWDVAEKKRKRSLDNLEGIVWAITLGKDEKHLAVATAPVGQIHKHTLSVHDLAANKVYRQFKNDVVADFAFSPDGQTFAFTNIYKITAWNLADATERVLWKGSALKFAFSPTGETLAIAQADRAVNIVDVNTSQSRLLFRGHTDDIVNIAFTDQGRSLVSGGRMGTIKTWDVANEPGPQILPTINAPSPVTAFAFSKDGRTLARLSSGFIKIWDLPSGEMNRSFQTLRNKAQPKNIHLSANGRVAYYYDEAGTNAIVNAETGVPIVPALAGTNYHIALSPDYTRLATVRDGAIVLWDAQTGTEIDSIGSLKSWCFSLAYSPDGTLLASGDQDGKITIWDIAKRTKQATIPVESNMVTALAFSRDGKTIASGGMDRIVRLWNVADSKLLASFEGHTNHINRLAFAGDDATLISSSDDDTVKLWNIATLQERFAIVSHKGVFALSPNGYCLVTADKDGNIKVWNAPSNIQVVQAKEVKPTVPDPNVPEPKVLPEVKGAILNVSHELTAASPRDRVRTFSHCREYKLELKVGVTYTMDMKSDILDTFLRLEDAARKEIAFDDDGGGSLDARIIFTPQRTGTYYLSATTYKPGQGPYTLIVREGGADDKLPKARLALQAKQWDMAVDLFAQIIQDSPTMRYQVIVDEYLNAGARDRLLDFYPILFKRLPNNGAIRIESARLAAELGRWPRAADDYAQINHAVLNLQEAYFEHVCLRLLVNDLAGFKQACPDILERTGKGKMRPYTTARIFTLTPLPEEDRKRAEQLAERELATMEHRYAALTLQGALDIRAGRHDDAQKKLRQCLTDFPNWEGSVIPRFWLALSLHGHGKAEESRKELALAAGQLDKWAQQMPNTPPRPGIISLHLHDWLEAQILRREVEKVLAK